MRTYWTVQVLGPSSKWQWIARYWTETRALAERDAWIEAANPGGYKYRVVKTVQSVVE